MKFIVSILTFLLVATFSATGQTYTNSISDITIKDFFDWRTNHKYHDNQVKIKRVRDTIVQWSTTDLGLLRLDTSDIYLDQFAKSKYKSLENILTPTNKTFILQQINELKTKYTWDKKIFTAQKIVKAKALNEIRKGTAYWEFSIPLFTADKQYCFIKETYVCGLLCIDWTVLCYQKTADGKWKLLMTVWAISS